MSRRPSSYAGIALALGVEVCRGIAPSGHYCDSDHRAGATTEDGVVHWGDRTVMLVGVFRFLKLVAMARDPSINDDTSWRRVYRLNVAVRNISKEINTQIPAKHLEYDRAFVRASVARLTNSEPMRKQAFDWSRRKENP